jgi:hypothetical protein
MVNYRLPQAMRLLGGSRGCMAFTLCTYFLQTTLLYAQVHRVPHTIVMEIQLEAQGIQVTVGVLVRYQFDNLVHSPATTGLHIYLRG